jgi:hypothetical protein
MFISRTQSRIHAHYLPLQTGPGAVFLYFGTRNLRRGFAERADRLCELNRHFGVLVNDDLLESTLG